MEKNLEELSLALEQEIAKNIEAIKEGANTVPYLDRGYVNFVACFGDDELACKFARTSFNNFDEEVSEAKNRGLINTLVENYHTSPLESCNITFQFKIPIFVERQNTRHRTARQNQQSFRYDECEGDYYLPPLGRIRGKDAWNKQGSGEQLKLHIQEVMREEMEKSSDAQFATYRKMIAAGVSKETARGVLGTNYYTVVSWQMDIKNLFNYLRLRDDGHAQWEIQVLAKYIDAYVQREFPLLHSAFVEFWKNSESFSETEMMIIRDFLAGLSTEQKQELLSLEKILNSKRRARDFKEKLGLLGE